jgi:hypothetical protein
MNVWGSNAQQVFGPDMIEATNHLGIKGRVASYSTLMELITKKVKIKEMIEEATLLNRPFSFMQELEDVQKINDLLYPVEAVYKLRDAHGQNKSATLADLDKLSELYDTNWTILVGLDRADPLKKDRTAARTIVTTIAKGLPSSASNPFIADNGNPQYIYIVLSVNHIADSLLEGIKDCILEAHETFDGVDAICGERWGIWDMAAWCEEQGISFEPIHPSYDKQKAAFSEIHGAISTGRFKIPPLVVWGSKGEDIFKEEAAIFFHDEEKRWFGSPEKMEKYGTQDDTMFAMAWSIYGGRELKLDDFKERNKKSYFGTMVPNRSTLIQH